MKLAGASRRSAASRRAPARACRRARGSCLAAEVALDERLLIGRADSAGRGPPRPVMADAPSGVPAGTDQPRVRPAGGCRGDAGKARDFWSRVDVMRDPEARVVEVVSATICDRAWRPNATLHAAPTACRFSVRSGRPDGFEGGRPLAALAVAQMPPQGREAVLRAVEWWSRRRRRRGAGQAAAVWWLWSLSRLWVAVMRRHSDRHADMPRRKKRSIRRLNLVFAKTGSIIVCRLP
jgi:hypothetical protein